MMVDWGWGAVGIAVAIALFWVLPIALLVLAIRALYRADRRSRYDGPPPGLRLPDPGLPGPVRTGEGRRGSSEHGRRGPVTPAPDALEILRDRYARGEIDEDEFDRRRAFLESDRGGGSGVAGEGRGPAGAGSGPAGAPPA